MYGSKTRKRLMDGLILRSALLCMKRSRVIQDTKPSRKKQIVEAASLMKSHVTSKAFPDMFVREIIANLTDGFCNEESYKYGLILVRGQQAVTTPAMIDEYFGITDPEYEPFENDYDLVDRTITSGMRTVWGEHSIPSRSLTSKYALLYFIGVYNWIPRTARMPVSKAACFLLYYIGRGKGFQNLQTRVLKLLCFLL